MLKIERGRFFKKDEKTIKLTDGQYQKYITYISLLINGKNLPIEAKDHSLKGEWEDTREFHIGGDVIVVYRIDFDRNVLQLIRIGSHNQVFKKF